MKHLRRTLLAPYHYAWAVLAAPWYGFPARKLTVIGVTGTKGKSSVVEMLSAILSAAGNKTALAGTIRFAIGDESRPNLFKMTLPGRGFIQKFLAEAVEKNCTHAVVEITSEAALQYRHLGLDLDALIFTNLQKEHVESHGSMENYFRAKFRIAESLVRSQKRPRIIVANADDARGAAFLAIPVEKQIPFSLTDVVDTHTDEQGVSFLYGGTHFTLPLPGEFNILNALAAIKTAETCGVPLATCAKALRELSRISGRVERIETGQDFIAVVDYAHTPDSLRALYGAFPTHRKICVLGNTGGGRDTWKRPEMGRIADLACDHVILTNEDPYDEDPRAIVDAMAAGMKRVPEIIMDRREAIRAALAAARPGDAVLISGKGTDPFIMGAKGSRLPWSDAQVVREELERLSVR
jgi:UDP-N-acetylmuramoyl-L-alanyl-D-glutamate--2,6-diaminopimelate ligase